MATSMAAQAEKLRDFARESFVLWGDQALERFSFEKFYQDWLEFFRSPDKNMFLRQDDGLAGFYPMNAERAASAEEPDPKEYFQILHGTDIPTPMRPATQCMFDLLATLSGDFLSILDFRLPSAAGVAAMFQDTSRAVLRVAHYPSTSTKRDFAAPHTDIDLITLLPPSSAPGLCVLGRDGIWREVAPTRGEVLVLAGDLLTEVTAGAILGAPHRVLAGSIPRLSVSFFANPPDDTKISGSLTAGDYVRRRLLEMGAISA